MGESPAFKKTVFTQQDRKLNSIATASLLDTPRVSWMNYCRAKLLITVLKFRAIPATH